MEDDRAIKTGPFKGKKIVFAPTSGLDALELLRGSKIKGLAGTSS